MATITGLTAERMQEIIDAAIVDADVIGTNLILTRDDGSTIDAGSVVAEATQVITTAAELAALTPDDGQEIIFIASETNGIIWRFRYRAAASGSKKWEFLGGPPLFDEYAAQENYVGVVYGALSGPSLTLPLAGDYDIQIGCSYYNNTAYQGGYMSYAIGGTAAVDADAVEVTDANTGIETNSRVRRKTALAAASVIASRYKVVGGGGRFKNRFMKITPVRVG